jgi:hypothetical protein
MIDFNELWSRYEWKPLRNCPGRYVLKDASKLRPEDLCENDVESLECLPAAAQDPVWVTRLKGGGLISYLKKDGNFVHTLNTEAGFARKLEQLGIASLAQRDNGI